MKAHQQCCQKLQYEHFNTNEFVINYGDAGQKFYIIIKGQIDILTPENQQDQFKKILELSDGQAFGELALEKNINRGASAKCRSEVHLAVLDKLDYKQILSLLVRQRRSDIVEYLSNVDIFKCFTRGSLEKISYSLTEKSFVKGEIVYKQNDQADYVYIIRQGEFRFTKLVKVQRLDTNKFKKNFKFCKVEIGIRGKNQLFGEERILTKKHYNQTCIAMAEKSLVYQISKRNFLKRMINSDIMNLFTKHLQQKNERIQRRIQYAKQLEETKMGVVNAKRQQRQGQRKSHSCQPPKRKSHQWAKSYNYVVWNKIKPDIDKLTQLKFIKNVSIENKLQSRAFGRTQLKIVETPKSISRPQSQRGLSMIPMNGYPVYASL